MFLKMETGRSYAFRLSHVHGKRLPILQLWSSTIQPILISNCLLLVLFLYTCSILSTYNTVCLFYDFIWEGDEKYSRKEKKRMVIWNVIRSLFKTAQRCMFTTSHLCLSAIVFSRLFTSPWTLTMFDCSPIWVYLKETLSHTKLFLIFLANAASAPQQTVLQVFSCTCENHQVCLNQQWCVSWNWGLN